MLQIMDELVRALMGRYPRAVLQFEVQQCLQVCTECMHTLQRSAHDWGRGRDAHTVIEYSVLLLPRISISRMRCPC